MTTTLRPGSGSETLLARIVPLPGTSARRASLMVERNALVYRRSWVIIVSGFFEPFFYLLSIGIGLGALVGTVSLDGRMIEYTAFVAPALLASSAMNGAVYDSTFNIFFKLKYAKTYDAILSTPMSPGDVAAGEITWALIRGLIYSTTFLAVMLALGLVGSPWAVLVLPAAVLIGFGFAAVGMAATTYMRGWQDFEFVQLCILPMFLFATTFYPLATYPSALQAVVVCTPLYHAVELIRSLTTGLVDGTVVIHIGYLVVMGLIGLRVAGRRLEKLLLT
ncbi:MAG: ABC transporter permease [Geodermatophilaceae bacterium]